MRVDAFDFELPAELIALRPARPRDTARLLVVDPKALLALSDAAIADLPGLLKPGDALVFNDTRVLPARLLGRRARDGGTGPRVEITLHKRESASRWRAFARPARKLTNGDRLLFGHDNNACLLGRLSAELIEKGAGGEVLLGFEFAGAVLDEMLGTVGRMPLPPYIASRRPPDEADEADYQTVYAERSGAVAAPTAGLHFTDELFQQLEAGGVSRHFLTLHVGAGSFLPVKAEQIGDHHMHAEWGEIAEQTARALNEIRRQGGRVVAVGTTALRLLESAVDPEGRIGAFKGDTDIFITPGYRFRAVDRLLTNFHLPRSTLFMLVAAFSGLEPMKRAYAHAVAERYRFYSYGDACLLSPAGTGR